MQSATFDIGGVSCAIVPGRKVFGLPDWHVIRTDTGAHLSLAYPEIGGNSVLFDVRGASWYRYNYAMKILAHMDRKEYFAARRRAGYPIQKRAPRARTTRIERMSPRMAKKRSEECEA